MTSIEIEEQKANSQLLQLVVRKVAEVVPYNLVQTYPREDHPEPDERGTSFKVLVQIVISQRATLEMEKTAAKRLFQRFETPRQLAAASIEDVAELIKPAGMNKTKAQAIVSIAEEVIARYGGDIDTLRDLPPNAIRDELLSLPRVGPKTADCMLELGFGLAFLPVDVNVDRVSKRLGLVDPDADKESVRLTLQAMIPSDVEVYRGIHTYLLALGKYFCKAIPKCSECPVVDLCPSSHIIGET